MVAFDEATHTYTVDGQIKQSVTQILKSVGIINYDGVNEYYRDRGTAIHDAGELLAQGWLDWSTVNDEYMPYLKTLEWMLTDFEYIDSEQPVFEPFLDYCGKYDLKLKRDSLIHLGEIKTSKKPADWWGLQVVAYRSAMLNSGMQVDDITLFSLGDESLYRVTNEDALYDVWSSIRTGTFDLPTWKSNKKRRYMERIKI